MLELRFTVADLARTRFVLSPLWEIVASIQVLKRNRPRALHRRWTAGVRARLAVERPELSLLFDLVQPTSWYLPDFLSAPPVTPIPDLDAELAVLRGTSTRQVRADLDVFAHALRAPAGSLAEASRPPTRRASFSSPRVASLYADPPAQLAVLSDQLATYWALAIEPHWGRIRAVLDEDLRYRGRRLGEAGPAGLFADLATGVRWKGSTLQVRHRRFSGARRLDGEGLLLVPSVFTWPNVYSNTIPPWQPSLTYPARGSATLWGTDPRPAPGQLSQVIGRSRAELLALLEAPASTTDLAAQLDLTPGGVSQHLGALHGAGLVTAHRAGRSVLYARTALAEALLHVADR